MKELGKIVVFIPARAGSKRVKAKNLRDLCGQPLISYSISTAKECFNFEDIYVNSDSKQLLDIARKMGINTYERDPALASDTATGDQFTADFIRNIKADTLVMISPVCPLISPEDVVKALSAYENSDCDTLITCESTQMQVFCNDLPINISLSEQLQPTQSNLSVEILNWALTIWNTKSFIDNYDKTGSAYIGKKRLLFPIDPLHGIKISNESDFKMAEGIISSLK